jgi:hypothetical protein
LLIWTRPIRSGRAGAADGEPVVDSTAAMSVLTYTCYKTISVRVKHTRFRLQPPLK